MHERSLRLWDTIGWGTGHPRENHKCKVGQRSLLWIHSSFSKCGSRLSCLIRVWKFSADYFVCPTLVHSALE